MNYGYSGLTAASAVFPFAFAVAAFIGLGVVVFTVEGGARHKRAEDSPVLTVAATIREKRAVARRRSGATADGLDLRTVYYVTFETESGERTVLRVYEQDYGRMAEGDSGRLSYRGERFLGFIKNAA
jgi:Protein of unknown function (DUF2500).